MAQTGKEHGVPNADIVWLGSLQCGDGFLQGVNLHRAAAPGRYGVKHQRQRGDMVQMRVCEKYMVDGLHFVQRKVAHACTCIDQDAPIDQKRGGAAVPGNRPGAAQHADFHGDYGLYSVSKSFVSRREAPTTRMVLKWNYLVSKWVDPSQSEL